MEAFAAQDNLAEALKIYSHLADCRQEELGASPSPATRDLYDRLLRAT